MCTMSCARVVSVVYSFRIHHAFVKLGLPRLLKESKVGCTLAGSFCALLFYSVHLFAPH
jgi:hypothetical protein